MQSKQRKADGRRVRGRKKGLHAINRYFSSLLLRSHSGQSSQRNLQLIWLFISKDKKTEKRSIIINMVCWNKKWLLGLEWSQEEQGHILPPSLPPCSKSGEQRPGMKELESQPFLVQLITMNNTVLITSYCSLQVLKVLCKGSMEEVGHSGMVSRGSSGLLGLPPAQKAETGLNCPHLHFTEHHL